MFCQTTFSSVLKKEKLELSVTLSLFFMFFFPYVAFDFVLGGVVGGLVVFSQLALQ